MDPILAATQLERTVQGAPMIVLLTIGALLALFWIFLPVVVWSSLRRIERLLTKIELNTRYNKPT